MCVRLDPNRSPVSGRTRTTRISPREILELHTLGVRSVYSQQDVTSFANVLTGWTMIALRQKLSRAGEFEFNPRMHAPGAQTVIGKSYGDTGVGQGEAVLSDLARHPATAHHVAVKLARHFVTDDPPASPGREACELLFENGWQPQGRGKDAGERAGGLGCSTQEI